MKAPLPDPFSPPHPQEQAPQTVKGPRPGFLLPLAIADVVWAVLYFALHRDASGLIGMLAVALLLYYLWIGQNWARLLYLVLTPLGMVMYFFPTEARSTGDFVLETIYLPISFAWLWVLTRPAMIEFTKGRRVA